MENNKLLSIVLELTKINFYLDKDDIIAIFQHGSSTLPIINEKGETLPAGTPVDVEFNITSLPAAAGQWTCKHVMFLATDGADALTGQVTFANFEFSIVNA